MTAISAADVPALKLIAQVFNNACREQGITSNQNSLFSAEYSLCVLCGAPTAGYKYCFSCNNFMRGDYGTLGPDICAPLFYAIEGRQSGTDIYTYKKPLGGVNRALERMQAVTYLFVKYHLKCLSSAVNSMVTHVVAVPSGRGRANHPLSTELLPYFGESLIQVEAHRTVPARTKGRQSVIAPSIFELPQFRSTDHVVVLEDTWVAGASALSLAVAVRQHGAGVVTIVPLARLLEPNYDRTRWWLERNDPLPPYNPEFCPVTRTSECP